MIDVLLGDRHLRIGIVQGVPGQAQLFIQLAQGVVADIQRLVRQVGLGLQISLVAAAGIQVETHAQHGLPFVIVAVLTINIVVRGATQLSIEARVERRLGRVVLLLGSGDIGFGRAQDRAVFQHLRTGFIQVGRHQRQETRRALQLIGHLADSGEVVGLGISQVGLLGDQVVARLGHPRLGLIEVGAATDATLGAQLDLVVNALVALEVVLGQAHEFAPGQHVEIDLGHGQPGTLGSTQQRVGAGVDGGLLTPDFAGRRKTVKNHLGQT
ncbi:hypothetical protein D3C78_971890 [compost metagenome]